jgi:hypothetical protein
VLDVRAPPEKVMAAMIDFSDRRPEIWPNLSAKIYQAHSVGENTADVTEGTTLVGGGVWERVTYEWTDTVVKIRDHGWQLVPDRRDVRIQGRAAGFRKPDPLQHRPQSQDVHGQVFRRVDADERRRPMKKSFYTVYGKPS